MRAFFTAGRIFVRWTSADLLDAGARTTELGRHAVTIVRLMGMAQTLAVSAACFWGQVGPGTDATREGYGAVLCSCTIVHM